MAQKSQYNFSGGVNSGVGNLLLKDNEVELILNYVLDEVGALKKRPGTMMYGGQANSGGVTGLFHFVSSTAANSAILATFGGASIYRLYTTTVDGAVLAGATSLILTDATNFGATGDGSTEKRVEINGQYIAYTTKTSNTLSGIPASGSGSITENIADDATARTFRASKTETATGKWRFFTLLDYVFAMNDGVTVRTATAPGIATGWGTTNAPGTITPSFGIVYKDKGYVSGDSTNPNKLYFSSKIDPTDTTISWDVTNDYIPVDPENGDKITGLGLNGNVMLVFKEFGTYRWDGNAIDTEPVIDVGTTSHDSIQTIHGITFFANRQGVWAYTKGQPKLISRKVQKWWNVIAVGSFDDLAAWIDQDHYYISITPNAETMTVDGVSYSTGVTLVYNIPLNAWTVETGHPFSIAATVTDPQNSNRYILVGTNYASNDGVRIFHASNTSDDPTSILSTLVTRPINGQIRSKETLINFPKKSKLENLYISMQQAVGANVGYRLDRSAKDFTPLKQCTQRVNQFDLTGDGSTLQVEITDNSKNQSIFEGFTVEYEPLPLIDKSKK